MSAFSPELFVTTLALVGAVVVIAALLSGAVERSGWPQVAVFLALGAVLGPFGLGIVSVGVESPILRVVATLSLVLVLFTDAVSLNMSELRSHKLLAGLVLGPGTVASAVLVSAAAIWILKVPLPLAAMLGAALASTDPVLLRSVLRRPDLSPPVRQALRVESGLNDAVLLPTVLVAIAATSGSSGLSGREWGRLALEMVILSPGAGIVVALAGIGSLELVRRRVGVRRDYESIYSLGVAFAAYAAAEAVHGSGFIAAFAAGLTIAALDVELCDCFLEYGETTAEMALLFTFVLFGVSIIWTGLGAISAPALLFMGATLLARPAAFLPALIPVRIRPQDRALIAWFGPRGLSSLLLILLPVFTPVPGSEFLLAICCLVVLASVVLHGFSPLIVFRPAKELPATATRPSSHPKETAVASDRSTAGHVASTSSAQEASPDPYIDTSELRRLNESGVSPILVDARSRRSFEDSNELLDQAIRLDPERPAAEAERIGVPRDAPLAVFCA